MSKADINIYRTHKSTTGDALFAEGPGHSAKAQKPSAKALPSAALGKGFAECRPRQRALGKKI